MGKGRGGALRLGNTSCPHGSTWKYKSVKKYELKKTNMCSSDIPEQKALQNTRRNTISPVSKPPKDHMRLKTAPHSDTEVRFSHCSVPPDSPLCVFRHDVIFSSSSHRSARASKQISEICFLFLNVINTNPRHMLNSESAQKYESKSRHSEFSMHQGLLYCVKIRPDIVYSFLHYLL